MGSDIRIALKGLSDSSKSIGEFLTDFYENMKELEDDPERGGKQATCIVMAVNDFENLIFNLYNP